MLERRDDEEQGMIEQQVASDKKETGTPRWLVTTLIAAAGVLLAWLTFCLQFGNASDQPWATFAESARLLASRVDTQMQNPGAAFNDFGDEQWEKYVISLLTALDDLEDADQSFAQVILQELGMHHGPTGKRAHEWRTVKANLKARGGAATDVKRSVEVLINRRPDRGFVLCLP